MKKIVCCIKLLAISLVIASCEIFFDIPVNLNLFTEGGKSILIEGKLGVAVFVCSSDDVDKFKDQLLFVFKGAEYDGCESSGMDDYLVFKIPIYIDNQDDGKPVDDEIANLEYFDPENGDRELTFSFPPGLKGKLNLLISASDEIKMDDINIRFHILPDLTPLNVKGMGVYLNDKPYQFIDTTLNSEFSVRIPHYGTRVLLSNETKEFVVFSTQSYNF